MRHFPALTEVDFDNNRIAATDEVRIKALVSDLTFIQSRSTHTARSLVLNTKVGQLF